MWRTQIISWLLVVAMLTGCGPPSAPAEQSSRNPADSQTDAATQDAGVDTTEAKVDTVRDTFGNWSSPDGVTFDYSPEQAIDDCQDALKAWYTAARDLDRYNPARKRDRQPEDLERVPEMVEWCQGFQNFSRAEHQCQCMYTLDGHKCPGINLEWTDAGDEACFP